MITNEHKLTKASFLLMKILLGLVLTADICRFVECIDKFTVIGLDIWNFMALLLILLSTTLLFVLILTGNKRVPVYWFIVFTFQLLSYFSGYNFMLNYWTFYETFPIITTVAYYVAPILLTLVDITYSISLTFLTESERITASKKGEDFGEFVSDHKQ